MRDTANKAILQRIRQLAAARRKEEEKTEKTPEKEKGASEVTKTPQNIKGASPQIAEQAAETAATELKKAKKALTNANSELIKAEQKENTEAMKYYEVTSSTGDTNETDKSKIALEAFNKATKLKDQAKTEVDKAKKAKDEAEEKVKNAAGAMKTEKES